MRKIHNIVSIEEHLRGSSMAHPGEHISHVGVHALVGEVHV